MKCALILIGMVMVASCSAANEPTRPPAVKAIAMPDDLAIASIVDDGVRAMANEVNTTGGHADVETYSIVRNSKCAEMPTSDGSPRLITCEFDSTTEFSPIFGDDDHIRKVMKDNSREWIRVNSIFQQDGENWKVQSPPTKL